jgi:lipid-A-disaccharide synthase
VIRPLRLFVVAGEPSGDLLAAALVERLRGLVAGPVELAGIGGEGLRAAGLRPLFPMDELAVMGLAEVLPRLPALRRRLAETAHHVREMRPGLLLTVDSPGFNLRLLQRLGGERIPRIHYVAPQAWAWRPRRAAGLAGLFDRLLALLPFEPPFFATHGVEATFVGHPAVERTPGDGDRQAFLARHGLGDAGPILLLLPGSRRQELLRHLPILGRSVAALRQRHPRLRAVLPTLTHLRSQVEAGTADWPARPLVVTGEPERRGAFASGDLALTASGTVTLELGLAGVPMVVAHRLHPLTGLLAGRLIEVQHVALANLVLGRRAVPELLQSSCTAEAVTAAAERLLDDPGAIAAQRADLRGLRRRLLPPDGAAPSLTAARAVLRTLGRRCSG